MAKRRAGVGDAEVPPVPFDLKAASPLEVRRKLAEALLASGALPDFELLRSGPTLVRRCGDWSHRLEVRADSRYNLRGVWAGTDLIAIVVHRRLRKLEKVNAGYPQSSGYMWALSGINLRRERIDPVADGWTTGYRRALAMAVEDWLPVLDRFQGDDWLVRVREIGDARVPWIGSALELLLGDGDVDGAAAHLRWATGVEPELRKWILDDLAMGPAPPGTARSSIGYQAADVLRRYSCEHLIDI